MAGDLEAKIEAARKRAAQAKARLADLEARASQQARRLDTRRKVILGGLLIDAAGKDDRFSKVITALMARMVREQDQKAFEGWLVPSPSPEPLGVNQPPSEPPKTVE
jgi:polyphosphate kinase 2 (PPK2 family)